MSEEGGVSLNRRDFLKIAGVGTGAFFLGNSFLGEWVENSNPEIPEPDQNLSEYEISWNARPWVWVNLAVASSFIDNTEIKPGEEVSVVELMKLDKMDEVSRTNTDPVKGYIAAQMSDPRKLDGWGYGLCLASTSLFRAALQSPLNITERHTHFEIYSEYFKDMPKGTDAAIYEPDPGDELPRFDLKLKNNTSSPIRLKFGVFDTDGTRIYSPVERVSDYIYKATYLDQVTRILQGKFAQLTGTEAPRQYFPQYMFMNKRIEVQAAFTGQVPNYKVDISPVRQVRMDEQNNTQFAFTRKLNIDSRTFTEEFISEYN